MLIIGSHVKFNKDTQLLGSLEETLSNGANTFMFYTGAPQNTKRSEININLVQKSYEVMKKNKIDVGHIIVHAPYIINLANNKEPEKYQFSINFLKEEIERCEQLGIYNLVLHPGSHVGLGISSGIESIIHALYEILEDTKVTILLETMAGKGSEIGSDFKEIKKIISGVKNKKNIGVCMDTCHMHDAGYDIENFDNLLEYFDEIVGLEFLKCIHINDSKNEKGSRKDRHENIGFGTIGFDTLMKIIYHKKLEEIPKILETPYVEEHSPYRAEIQMIKEKKFHKDLKKEIKNSVE